MIIKKHNKVFTDLHYTEQLELLVSPVNECAWISDFDSLVVTPTGITRSAVWIKVCLIITGIQTYMSIIKKKIF